MSARTDRHVTVGVDGSAAALAAVDLASREAALRHRPLRVVHAFSWPSIDLPLETLRANTPASGLVHQAEGYLAEAVGRARAAVPGIDVTAEVVAGAAAPVLIRESHTACLVVIGDRGLGGFTGLLVGSVAVALATYGACPVLVARGEPRTSGDVLVGVDGSPASAHAVEAAFEEAGLRGVALTALHAWTHPVSTAPGDMLPLVYDADEVSGEEERVLAEALAGWADKYPDVVVRRRLIRGRPGPSLIEASRDAQLVVVATRGRGGFTGLLLGSVSQAVLHHADCPTMIVRRTSGESR